jgi:hypothetical protein
VKKVLIAVSAAALALAGIAAAKTALPAKNALLGGGMIGTKFVHGAHHDVGYTSIRVDKKTGKSVHVYGEWPTACTSTNYVTAVFDTVVPLKADGTFAGSGVTPKNDVVPEGVSYRFSGKFLGPTAAQVVGSATFAFVSNGKSSKCASRNVRTEVRTTPKVTGTPSPKAGAAYYGNTSDTAAVALRVAANGKSVAQTAEEGWLDCKTPELKANGGPFLRNTSPPAAIGADGTFHGEETFDDSTGAFGAGTVAHIRSVLDGKFGATSVGGTWTVTADVVDQATNAAKDTCTRKVTWAASL